MKKLLRRLLLIASITVLLFVPYLITRSCGPDLPLNDFRFSLFQPDLSGFNDLAPFYYTPDYVGYFFSDPKEKDYQRNCAEWQAITGKGVSLKDISTIQYQVSPDDFLYAVNRSDWKLLKDNSFVQWLRQPANKDLLTYMAFAKQVEFTQFGNNIDPWAGREPQEGERLTITNDSLTDIALKRSAASTSDFLKQRYAFQAVKLLHYTYNDTKKAALRQCYDTYLQNKKTVVADWGLLYYAFAQKDTLLCTKYLLHAFDKSEEKKSYSFGNISTRELDALIASHPDAYTTAIALAVKGIKNPGRALSTVQQLVATDPGNRYVPLLLCREVNKLEDWISSPKVLGFQSPLRAAIYEAEHPSDSYDTTYTYYADKNLASDKQYMRTVRDYLIQLLNSKKSNADMLLLAIAHLYNMDEQYGDAKYYLDKLPQQKDITFQRQAITERIVASIYGEDITNKDVKASLVQQFKQLDKVGTKLTYVRDGEEQDGWEKPSKDIRSYLLLLLSQRFRQKGDIVTAGMLFNNAKVQVNEYMGYDYGEDTTPIQYNRIAYFDNHASAEDIDKLIAFKHQSRKTEFEQLLAPKTWAPDDFYKDVKGTILIRQGRFKEALDVMKTIDERFWEEQYDYGTYLTRTYIGSAGTLLPGEDTRKHYRIASKKAIVQDIVLLQDSLANAKKPQQKAYYNFRLGNAYYNISYSGRSWMMSSYGKSAREQYYGADNYNWASYSCSASSKPKRLNYYQCVLAMSTYKQALQQAAGDKELSAKILMMLSVADKASRTFIVNDRDYVKGIHHYSDDDKPYTSPYLRMLKDSYADTRIFALGETECPDIAELSK